jgi:pimeloyl-ACP methyl ester carboxylesterase
MKSYRLWGSPPTKVAVIHGGPGTPGAVAAVAEELSRTVGVLEPFQSADSIAGQVEELRDLLEKHCQLPVVLVGHSWGSALSYILTAQYPALVRKLIIIGGGPLISEYARTVSMEILTRLSEADRLEFLRMADIYNGITTGDPDRAFARIAALAGSVDICDPLPLASYVPPEGYTVSARINRNIAAEITAFRDSGRFLEMGRDIICPVLAIHGDYDTHPVAGIREPLAGVVKDFKFILLEKCGHEPWRERYARDKFFEILRKEIFS